MLNKRKIFFVFLFFFFFGCVKKENKGLNFSEAPLLEESPSALQRIDNFSLEGFTEVGEKQWEIRARSADVTEDLVKMEDVKATAWGEEGKVDLESEKGEYDKGEKKIYLSNNVLIRTSEGTKLITDELTWDIQKQEADTDKEVVVERENFIAKGKGAVALTETKKVALKENVEVKAEPATIITCEGPLELDYEKNVAKFYEKVKVEDERGKIFADRMDVFFYPQEKKIEKIFAYGNIKITHEGNIAYADEAIYDAKEKKIILKGSPRLVIVPEE